MTSTPEPQTVRDRFLAAGVLLEDFEMHLAAGRIMVGIERVTDPDTPAPRPTSIGIGLDLG